MQTHKYIMLQNVELLIIKEEGTCSYHWALKF
jgi:hypothetical protein